MLPFTLGPNVGRASSIYCMCCMPFSSRSFSRHTDALFFVPTRAVPNVGTRQSSCVLHAPRCLGAVISKCFSLGLRRTCCMPLNSACLGMDLSECIPGQRGPCRCGHSAPRTLLCSCQCGPCQMWALDSLLMCCMPSDVVAPSFRNAFLSNFDARVVCPWTLPARAWIFGRCLFSHPGPMWALPMWALSASSMCSTPSSS